VSEYYLEFWGRDAEQACKLVGDIGPKSYFATAEARDRVAKMIRDSGLLVVQWDAIVQDRKRPVAVVTLSHCGKQYTVEMPYFPGYEEDSIAYHWDEGNYSCDCNRSRFIRDTAPDFPDMECGDEIELVSIRVEYRETETPR
jgi:hypothetical protein